jgi:DNA-binding response OmpR family regulator
MSSPRIAAPGSQGRILIVEGVAHHAAVVHLGLDALGYDVRRTGRPGEALRFAQTTPPALFVIAEDVDGGAATVCRSLRDAGLAQPILVLGSASERDEAIDRAVAAVRAGAQDYLGVPHDLPALEARVERLLRSATSSITAQGVSD